MIIGVSAGCNLSICGPGDLYVTANKATACAYFHVLFQFSILASWTRSEFQFKLHATCTLPALHHAYSVANKLRKIDNKLRTMCGATLFSIMLSACLASASWISSLRDGLKLQVEPDVHVVQGEWTILITIDKPQPPPELLRMVAAYSTSYTLPKGWCCHISEPVPTRLAHSTPRQ